MTELSKAEKLARKMHNIISGGQSFNKQVAAQVRDELRRQDRELEVARNFAAQMRYDLETAHALLREGADMLSVESDALKSGISIGDKVSADPADAHTIDAISEIEGWIAKVAEAQKK